MNIENEKIDVKENTIYKLDSELLSILLQDKTTMKNIIWATDIYEDKGINYSPNSQMTINTITGFNGQVIKPRIKKSKKDQLIRSKEKGEVFTPSWICNEQNNLADDSWFGYSNVFNIPTNKGWITNKGKIKFPNSKPLLPAAQQELNPLKTAFLRFPKRRILLQSTTAQDPLFCRKT